MKDEKKKVLDPETERENIENGKDLTLSERVKAFMAGHAIEHYCSATGADVETTTTVIEALKNTAGQYWRYTCPSYKENTPKPKDAEKMKEWQNLISRKDWESANKGVIRCDVIDSRQWYKKSTEIVDATTIRSLLAAAKNYADAVLKGRERKILVLKSELTEAFLAGDIEKATKIAAEIKTLTE